MTLARHLIVFGMLVIFKKNESSWHSRKSFELINWLSKQQKQRVTFSGVKSYWNSLKASVPQGSVLGSLLFLLYI